MRPLLVHLPGEINPVELSGHLNIRKENADIRPVDGHEGSLRVNVDDFIPRLNEEVRCIETSDLIVFCNEDDGSVD